MPHPKGNARTRKRRVFSEEFKQEAVQMLLARYGRTIAEPEPKA